MDYALRFHSHFDASHLVEGVEGCDRRHGHTFDVTVSISGPLVKEASGVYRVARSENVQSQLDAATAELDRRDLNDMMVGSVPTPETIAAWILERIPEADWVEVAMGWRRETGWSRRNKR